MENLNKESLISAIAEKTNEPKTRVRKVVEEVFNTISECLAEGKKCQYIGFGTFQVKERAARTGYNPATHDKQELPAKKVAGFKPGKNLAEKVAAAKAE